VTLSTTRLQNILWIFGIGSLPICYKISSLHILYIGINTFHTPGTIFLYLKDKPDHKELIQRRSNGKKTYPSDLRKLHYFHSCYFPWFYMPSMQQMPNGTGDTEFIWLKRK